MNDEDADWNGYTSITHKEKPLSLSNSTDYTSINSGSFFDVERFHCQEESVEHEHEEEQQEQECEHEEEEHVHEQVDGSIGEDCLKPIGSSLDLTDYFTTEEVFDSKESVRNWCMQQGKEMNCVIVCKSSRVKNSDGNGKGSYLEMQCERSGLPVSHKSKHHVPKTTRKRKRQCGSNKCGCPFMLSALCKNDGKWHLRVKCGVHNHSLPDKLTGHAYVARLTEEEMKKVENMTKAGVRPRMILRALKEANADSHCTMRTIYNARALIKANWNEGRSAMQQFMKLCDEHKYTVEYKFDPTTNEVTDLFYAHPKYVLLAQCFHKFILVDNTYKTNRYNLPLFHVVSHTSTGKTFTVALAFMSREKKENYIWALECVKRLYREGEIPSVIVTDADNGLINAVECVFPAASHLLCTWHIGKNVFARCAKFFRIKDNKEDDDINDDNKPAENKGTVNTIEEKKNEDRSVKANKTEEEKRREVFDKFMDDWKALAWSSTKEEYHERYKAFCVIWSPKYNNAVQYVRKTWLSKFKEKFVCAWTNKIKHYDNVATSRVESAHGTLKLYLGTSQGSFVTCWHSAHQKYENNFVEIEADFEVSTTRTMHEFMKQPMLVLLLNNVSHMGLRLLCEELGRVDKHGSDLRRCGCVLYTISGLPCAHMLYEYKNSHGVIPLSSIDPFWMQLSTTPPARSRTTKEFDELPEIKGISETWDKATDSQRIIMQSALRVIWNPKTTYLKEPKVSEVQHGRPTKLQQLKHKRDLSEFEHVQNALKGTEPKMSRTTPAPEPKMSRTTPAPQTKTMSVERINDIYLKQLPLQIQPFIYQTEDVEPDGHCGYWVVVKQLKLYKKNELAPWKYVRDEMIKNLKKLEKVYKSAWGIEGFNKLMTNIDFPTRGVPMSSKYWMIMPEAGFLISEAFTTVVVYYSEKASMTFVPNQVKPSTKTKNRIIFMGLVNKDHYISLQMEPNAPIPPYPSYYFAEKILTDCGKEWLGLYERRIAIYEAMARMTKCQA